MGKMIRLEDIEKTNKQKKELISKSELANKEKLQRAIASLSALSLDSMSQDELSQVVGFTKLQEASKLLKTEQLKSQYDIDTLVTDFLKTKDSQYTKASYKTGLNTYLAWIHSQDLHALTINSKEVDLFASYVKETFSQGKANLAINATSSFYKALQKWNIRSTPFIDIKRSKKQPKKTKNSINLDTILDILKSAKYGAKIKDRNKASHVQEHYKYYYVAIQSMYLHGLRVGSFEDMKVRSDHTYTTTTKGKVMNGKLNSDITLEALKSLREHLKTTNTKAFTVSLNRFLRSWNVSCHDLRHYFAVNLYKTSGYDIHKVSQALNHSNIAITSTYLKSLGAIE